MGATLSQDLNIRTDSRDAETCEVCIDKQAVTVQAVMSIS